MLLIASSTFWPSARTPMTTRGWIEPKPPSQKSGKKVAVVGSGPAGMACAQQNGSEQGEVPDSGSVYGGISSTAHFFFCERCFLSKKA